MISNQCIVCMPLTTWDTTFTNTLVKLMTLLSKENKVLFVDYQFTLKDVLFGIRGNKRVPVKRILGFEKRLRLVKTSIGSGLHVLTCPPVVPANWIKGESSYKFILNLNASIVKGWIQSAIKDLNMDNIIVINGYNSFLGLPMVGELNEMLNIYYCYDEIKGDIWYKNHGAAIEEEYLRKTDLVITTSDALYKSKSIINPNCYTVKNGVDFNLFHKVAYEANDPGLPKVVGYTGSVDERFDLDTVCYTIENIHDVIFEFVGRITNPKTKERLSNYNNVRIMGSQNPEQVPEFLKNMDLCIIPYLKTEVTKGVYPLKINEYLAAGKPVVMTDFADLPEFSEVVKVASSKENFLQFIKEELSSDALEKKNRRIEIAKSNSWENRVEELSMIIERFVEMKMEKTA